MATRAESQENHEDGHNLPPALPPATAQRARSPCRRALARVARRIRRGRFAVPVLQRDCEFVNMAQRIFLNTAQPPRCLSARNQVRMPAPKTPARWRTRFEASRVLSKSWHTVQKSQFVTEMDRFAPAALPLALVLLQRTRIVPAWPIRSLYQTQNVQRRVTWTDA